jgi:hypothetical protein
MCVPDRPCCPALRCELDCEAEAAVKAVERKHQAYSWRVQAGAVMALVWEANAVPLTALCSSLHEWPVTCTL